MLINCSWRHRIVENVPQSVHYIGITAGGSIITTLTADKRIKEVSIVKDRELKGKVPGERFLLIYDVVMSEGSLTETYKVLSERGVFKDKIDVYYVVDRRSKNERFESEINV